MIHVFTLDISISMLETLIAEVKAKGGDAMRFTVYESTDEIPVSFATKGLLRPSTELDAGEGSFFPGDWA